jgi:hypothetical protein
MGRRRGGSKASVGSPVAFQRPNSSVLFEGEELLSILVWPAFIGVGMLAAKGMNIVASSPGLPQSRMDHSECVMAIIVYYGVGLSNFLFPIAQRFDLVPDNTDLDGMYVWNLRVSAFSLALVASKFLAVLGESHTALSEKGFLVKSLGVCLLALVGFSGFLAYQMTVSCCGEAPRKPRSAPEENARTAVEPRVRNVSSDMNGVSVSVPTVLSGFLEKSVLGLCFMLNVSIALNTNNPAHKGALFAASLTGMIMLLKSQANYMPFRLNVRCNKPDVLSTTPYLALVAINYSNYFRGVAMADPASLNVLHRALVENVLPGLVFLSGCMALALYDLWAGLDDSDKPEAAVTSSMRP